MTHNFRHIQDNNGRFKANTETGNKTTSNDRAQGRRRAGYHLDDDADNVDYTSENDGPLAADPIGHVAGDKGTDEGTDGQDGDDQRGFAF